jgi:methylglutaconyl-CoA hydratase
MGYAHLTCDIDSRGVASILLNRPQVHNAFDSALIAEITECFKNLSSDASVRIAVLAGNGKSFCAGGDLNWMRSMKDFSRAENIADSETLATMYATLHSFPKPLIGVVHGAALGGGSGLAAVCDYVVAAEDASFGFTETRIGILPAVISPYALEKIGVSAARAYFISGMRFSAQTAKEIGLVHRVVARDTLPQAREEAIAEFLKAAPEASIKAKALIRELQKKGSPEAARSLTIETIADARISAEGQEGMDALLNSRPAKWVQP